jgi:ERCC4-type nuclease
VCRILVDFHERRCGVPDSLESLGVEVEFAFLAAGDYSLGPGVLMERKATFDFHRSLAGGRLWRQLGRMRQHQRELYLLVEGRRLDEPGIVHPNAVRGACLATMRQGIRVIFSEDADDSARWLSVLARRLERGQSSYRPAYAQVRTQPGRPGQALLAAVPGISARSAEALLDTFGSVRSVVNAGPEQWTNIPGIGKRRAQALADALS